jgi:hypothetical protein
MVELWNAGRGARDRSRLMPHRPDCPLDCTAHPPKALLFRSSAVERIFVCDMPGSNWILRPIVPPADLSQMMVKPVPARIRKKVAPETGATSPNHRRSGRWSDCAYRQKPCIFRTQRPKRGRSPLRMAMRLLAVSRRSMEAIRRPNRVLEGRRPIDAVLDMFVPFSLARNHSAS